MPSTDLKEFYKNKHDPTHRLSLQFMRESPPIDRDDAPVARAITDRLVHAEDLWDGTLEDLAGYLRMMGSLITGYLDMREIMPENRGIKQYIKRRNAMPIFNVFLAGQTGRTQVTTCNSPAAHARAQRKLNSYAPAIREVVSSCAMLHYCMIISNNSKEYAEGAGRFLQVAMDQLLGFDDKVERARLERSTDSDGDTLNETDVLEGLTKKKLSTLQQAVEDSLGVTSDELNLGDVQYYSAWCFAAFALGLDFKHQPQLNRRSPAEMEQMGMTILHYVNGIPRRYLPVKYDRARHMLANPSLYTPDDVVNRTFPGYASILMTYHFEQGGRSWSQLCVLHVIVQGVLAGGIPFLRGELGHQKVEDDFEHFTAGQLKPFVEAAEVLLDRMRPWLGDDPEFKKADDDVKGWREMYITGKHDFELQQSVSKRAGVSRMPDAPGKKQCAACGASPEKLKVCSACRQVWYCNGECQKAGWKAHKKECIASRKSV